jgi:hypothetical protein
MNLTQLRRSNDLLATSFSRPDGVHPRYQWCSSEDLLMATPILNSDGTPKMEFICNCGVDRRIHAPDCPMTVATVKFMQIKVIPTLVNSWVFCGWFPPPSQEKWATTYGSFRYYPSNGRFIPFEAKRPGSAPEYIQIPFPAIPFMDTTRRIIQMIQDHEATKARRDQEMVDAINLKDARKMRESWGDKMDYTPPANSKWASIQAQLKDKMTLNGAKPGTKGSVLRFSESGLPILESAMDRQLQPQDSRPDTLVASVEKPLITVAS